jgi:hypothetical protein
MSERLHQRIFFAVNGLGPYPCFDPECGQTVSIEDVIVHHIDYDHDNNDPVNLTGMHRKCHQRLHAKLRTWDEDQRENFRQSRLGSQHTLAARRKMSDSHTGKKHSPETRAKMSAAAKARWSRPDQ